MKFKANTIEKIIKTERKALSLAIGYKKRDYCFYKKFDDYFVSIMATEYGMLHNEIEVEAEIKPMYVDDIFWDIMDWSSNKTSALSLRAVGAFTVRGLDVFSERRAIEDISEVHDVLYELTEKSASAVEELMKKYSKDPDAFDEMIEKSNNKYSDLELYEILRLIHLNDFSQAKKVLEKALSEGRKGRFANGNKYVYQAALEYCSKQNNI